MKLRNLFLFLSVGVLLVRPAGTQGAAPASGSITVTTAVPVTWNNDAPGTGADSEPDAILGLNKDTFILHVGGTVADWAGKVIVVSINWTVPANDRDLYIHRRNADGSDGFLVHSSAGGAPQTGEHTFINPAVVGVGDFNINTVYFACAPAADQPVGTATVGAAPPLRTASYTKGGMTFSPNTSVRAPTAYGDSEPSSRCDQLGNYFISPIRGVPGGVDLWYFDLRPTLPGGATNPNYDPFMRSPLYLGQPDSGTTTAGGPGLQAGALGGGDIDIALGFGNYSGPDALLGMPTPALAYASLTAANVTVGRSLDRGQTFQFNGVGNFAGGAPINDRQWMNFFGPNTVFLDYRNFAQGIAFVQRSTNGGLTYEPAVEVGNLPQTGSIDVDQFDGTVYITGNDGSIAVGIPSKNPPPLNTAGNAPLNYFITSAVGANTDAANLFFAMRVANDHRDANGNPNAPGTVYAVFSDGKNVYLTHSIDHGTTWSNAAPVNDPNDPEYKINLFPWLATGPTPGSVGIAWYATSGGPNDPSNDQGLTWRVYYAQTFDATSNTPHFRIAQASDHGHHAANISLSGLVLTGGPNRNLADYFQIVFDPTGAAILGYTDDHSDFSGYTYVTRQVSGPSINGGTIPTPVEGSSLPVNPFPAPGNAPLPNANKQQPMQPGPNGEQVTDFAQDVDSTLLAVTPSNSPVDILSIKYESQNLPTVGPVITATMVVSDLTTIPQNTHWRMYFTANAPETGVAGPTGDKFSTGLSDHGDQFWIEASTGDAIGLVPPNRTSNWGTTARTSSGFTSDTTQGAADGVFFNQTSRTISARISLAKINAYLTANHRPTIGVGSVLCGLRGNTYELVGSGVDPLEDETRGGTEFTITNAR